MYSNSYSGGQTDGAHELLQATTVCFPHQYLPFLLLGTKTSHNRLWPFSMAIPAQGSTNPISDRTLLAE